MTKTASVRLPGALAGVVAGLLLAAHPVAAQTKVTDRWITIVLPAEPADIDGCQASRALQGRVVKQNVVETLVEKNPNDGTLSPRLALSWEQREPTVWRFKLRPGVVFHDGSPFNAEAVKKSLARTVSAGVACGDKSKFFAGITMEGIVVDELTLDIKTSRAEPIIPMRLAGAAIVGPNEPLDKLSIAPVGTGPFALDGWQGGQQILLKRFDKYWGAKPQAEGVRYVWRAESAVRAAMVKLGEADIAHSISEQDANDAKTDYAFLNSETAFLRIDLEKAPLNDKRVRQALHYAVDLDSIPGTVMPKASLRATQMVMPSIPGHNHGLDKNRRPYDPTKARALLAEAKAAGVPVDTEIVLISYPAAFPNAAEMMETVHTMLRGAGFNVKLIVAEPGVFQEYQNKPYNEKRQPVLLQSTHDNNFGDPVFSISGKYGCEARTSTLCDPAFDKEIERISSLGGTERFAAWEEVFRHLYEDVVPDVMLYHLVGFLRVNPRIDFKPDVTSNSEIRVQEIHFR